MSEPKAESTPRAGEREEPAFLRGRPADPALDRLVEAFLRGNFHAVRLGAPRLVSESPDERVRRVAADLLRRTRPDPLALLLLGASATLFLVLVVYFYGAG